MPGEDLEGIGRDEMLTWNIYKPYLQFLPLSSQFWNHQNQTVSRTTSERGRGKKEVGFEFEVIGPTYVCPSLLKFAKLFLNCLLLLCVHPCLTNCGLQLQIYHCPAYIWRLYSARPYYPLTSSEIRGATWQLKFSPFVFTICHLCLFNGCTRMRLHAL